MAFGDVWRVGMSVRTFNQVAPLPPQFFEWAVVYHYEVTTSPGSDQVESDELVLEQAARMTAMATAFAGDTDLHTVNTLNVDSLFSDFVTLDLAIGVGGNNVLPAQVAVAISGAGATLGRRALKYWGSINRTLLGDNGVLLFGGPTDSLRDNTYREVAVGPVGRFRPVIFSDTELPAIVPITTAKVSSSFRTQRRRVLDMTQ